MTLGSLFDGIGGFPYVAQMCGITPVWASEIEKNCVQITQKHFPEMEHLGDITKIDGAKIAPVDIITFGSPCQDMSIAGKRAGLGGERSGLFMEAVRIIKEMREATHGEYPTYAVWENVTGAFSSNKGEDFRVVLEELCSIQGSRAVVPRPPRGWKDAGLISGDGYSLSWRVLDAQYMGVPQRRRRIYAALTLGDITGRCAGEILFEPKGERWDSAQSRTSRQRVAGSVETGVSRVVNSSGEGIAGTLDASYYKGSGARSGKEREYVAVYSFDARGNGDGSIVSTITGDHENRVTDYTALCTYKSTARRLTPLETERLQGYPDNWTEGFSDSARYRAIGNSLALPCAYFVICGIAQKNRPPV